MADNILGNPSFEDLPTAAHAFADLSKALKATATAMLGCFGTVLECILKYAMPRADAEHTA